MRLIGSILHIGQLSSWSTLLELVLDSVLRRSSNSFKFFWSFFMISFSDGFSDILNLIESECSGRRSCVKRVPSWLSWRVLDYSTLLKNMQFKSCKESLDLNLNSLERLSSITIMNLSFSWSKSSNLQCKASKSLE